MADPKNFTWEPPDKNISIANARNYFLTAIEAISPEVLAWLYKNAFPYFKIIYQEISDSYSLDGKIKTFTEKLGPRLVLAKHINDLLSWSSYEVATENIYPDLLPLKKRIDEWVDKYFLHSEGDWIQRQALETMHLWTIYGNIDIVDALKGEWVGYPGGVCWPGRKTPLTIELPCLNDTEMTRSQITAYYEDICKKNIENYLDEKEAAREDQGWQKHYKKTVTERFEWLVYYQIKGLSHRDIVKKVVGLGPGNTERAKSAFESARRMVGKGIATAKKECGIILRQAASPGRKRKT